MTTFNNSTKSSDIGNRTIRFTISDETADRAGEVMVAAGCDFSQFAKNPQFLGFHDQRNLPIALPKAWGIDSRTRSVWMDVYFPTVAELSSDPETATEHVKMIDSIYAMYKIGMLSAVSVGFKPIDSEYRGDLRFITRWELLEVSAVPVPCNPNALVQMKSIEGISPKLIEILEGKTVEIKAGAMISKPNRERLKGITDRIDAAHKEIAKCNKELMAFHAEPEAEEPSEPEKDPAYPGDDSKSFDLDKFSKYLGIEPKKDKE